MDFNIHLNSRNTIMCTGNLEVHIAKEVFQTLNICQHQIIFICISRHQSGRYPGNRGPSGSACDMDVRNDLKKRQIHALS